MHYVRPHFANFGRQVKMPKLYMTDVICVLNTTRAASGRRHRGAAVGCHQAQPPRPQPKSRPINV